MSEGSESSGEKKSPIDGQLLLSPSLNGSSSSDASPCSGDVLKKNGHANGNRNGDAAAQDEVEANGDGDGTK